MVVPIRESSDDNLKVDLSEIKKFVGNNLQLRLSQNTCTMVVIGNNCSIKVSGNFGVIKVIGNNCIVDINKCQGSVEYVGNNGSVFFGCDNVRSDAVSFKGKNGTINAKNASTMGKSKKSKSKGRLPTATQLLQEGGVLSLENLNNFIRSHYADSAVYINDNVKVLNPRIKVNTIDLSSILYTGLIAK